MSTDRIGSRSATGCHRAHEANLGPSSAALLLSAIKLPNQSLFNLLRAPFPFGNSADVRTVNAKTSCNPRVDAAQRFDVMLQFLQLGGVILLCHFEAPLSKASVVGLRSALAGCSHFLLPSCSRFLVPHIAHAATWNRVDRNPRRKLGSSRYCHQA